ncbi:hypothetical protein PPYR_08726 [Photinus pyralis]|uniref:CRAL-TRIO domain-containing protein n=3 Tax=Photinus pyralis TaxID=7054 RepID=A0A5N4AKC6_PHOPY|nr:retinol-binding protein pinta-like [Photinus pyralis]XP_031343410.1 retinol-binding protein pinta-like [Photinus pyralis]KAB0797733.1 hypothetical protein PPYR_08726 [Photinus pyralis]
MQCCRLLAGELQTLSEDNLNEASERAKHDIHLIHEWHRKQPHLNFPIDDQLILSFLRCTKFSIERTKQKIDNYYTMRTLVPEILCNRDPFSAEIQAVLSAGVVLPLPNRDEDGCKIILCNYRSNLNANTMHCSIIVKVICMVLDILLREDDDVVVNGLKTWAECKGCPSEFSKQVTPSFLKKATCVTENGFPFRVQGIYTKNCPALLEFIYNIVKVFFSKKLTNRTFLYSEYNLHQFYTKIPQISLPEEFGGQNGSVKELTSIWKKKVESYRDFFIEEEQRKSNEKLRQCQQILDSDVFGVEGSFRKLDID